MYPIRQFGSKGPRLAGGALKMERGREPGIQIIDIWIRRDPPVIQVSAKKAESGDISEHN